MSRKVKVLFRWSDYNHYSISVLVGLLDEKLDPNRFEVKIARGIDEIIKQDLSNDSSVTIAAYSFSTLQLEDVKTEIQFLREQLGSKIIIVSGGPHTTALPEDVLNLGVDVVFVGEAEESLPHFLNSLYESGGVLEDKIIKPVPLKNFNDYPPFAYKRNLFTPIEIRRGCNIGCAFCQTPRIFKHVRERSKEYVKDYVAHIKKRGRANLFFIIPDVLSYGSSGEGVNLKYLESFLEEVTKTEMKINLGNFPSEISPRRLSHHPEAADILKKYVQNKKIFLGGQSGSENVLKIMNRDHSVGDIEESVKILKSKGFLPIVDILFGIPGENKDDRLETLNFMRGLKNKYRTRFNIHYFIPLPGTPLERAKPEVIESETKEEIYKFMKDGYGRGYFFEQMKLSPNDIILDKSYNKCYNPDLNNI